MTDPQHKPAILLADDDSDYLYQIRFALEKAGFSVFAAESMEEADLLLDTERPDIAVFDLMMERDDAGFVLAYHARRKHPGMPVVILTAVTAETGRRFGQEDPGKDDWIKADLYLEKGLHPDRLIGHIHSLLAR